MVMVEPEASPCHLLFCSVVHTEPKFLFFPSHKTKGRHVFLIVLVVVLVCGVKNVIMGLVRTVLQGNLIQRIKQSGRPSTVVFCLSQLYTDSSYTTLGSSISYGCHRE